MCAWTCSTIKHLNIVYNGLSIEKCNSFTIYVLDLHFLQGVASCRLCDCLRYISPAQLSVFACWFSCKFFFLPAYHAARTSSLIERDHSLIDLSNNVGSLNEYIHVHVLAIARPCASICNVDWFRMLAHCTSWYRSDWKTGKLFIKTAWRAQLEQCGIDQWFIELLNNSLRLMRSPVWGCVLEI